MTTRALIVVSLLGACAGEIDNTPQPPAPDDPWGELGNEQQDGPPRYSSRVHSCAKMRYLTLGNLLKSRGVNLAATDPVSAGKIFMTSASALGAPNLVANARETIDLGLATTSRMFDIYVQAAPEIIANMPTRPECQISGVGARMFDAQNHCMADGIACLMGVPATQAHIDLCNLTIARADDIESGKRIAVATLAAAAHTCE